MDIQVTYVIAYDIGSTSNKICLYELSNNIKLLAQISEKYPINYVENGGVEQDPDSWWNSMIIGTPKVLAQAGINAEQIEAISFCSQMQGLVLTDKNEEVLRPAMSYMDKRATSEFEEWCSGVFKAAGMNARKTIISLMETGATAGSAKDPVFRYKWVKKNEPHIFEKIDKWLDVKDYLVYRCTGNPAMSRDSAFGTLLYSDKKKDWSEKVCKLHDINMDHLPVLVESTDQMGTLRKDAAAELGLTESCQVFSGGGDSTLIAVGAGCTNPGETHMYIGTSGWVSTVVDKSKFDITSMIASVVGIRPGRYNYFAEMETSGKCIDWAREHLSVDKIENMIQIAKDVPAGSNGVVFMPWLLGNRCPFEDAHARGGFFNVSLTTTKADMMRSVLEGILHHKRWMLERHDAKISTSQTIRVVGGGAKSKLLCQIIADMTGRTVERTTNPQNAGALGAAILMSYGLGYLKTLDNASEIIEIADVFAPIKDNKLAYDKAYMVFKRLHGKNKKNFYMLNAD